MDCREKCSDHLKFEGSVFSEISDIRKDQMAIRRDIANAIDAWRVESERIREILQGALSLDGDGLIARVNKALDRNERMDKEFSVYKKIAWGMISSVLLGAAAFIFNLITHTMHITKAVP